MSDSAIQMAGSTRSLLGAWKRLQRAVTEENKSARAETAARQKR